MTQPHLADTASGPSARGWAIPLGDWIPDRPQPWALVRDSISTRRLGGGYSPGEVVAGGQSTSFSKFPVLPNPSAVLLRPEPLLSLCWGPCDTPSLYGSVELNNSNRVPTRHSDRHPHLHLSWRIPESAVGDAHVNSHHEEQERMEEIIGESCGGAQWNGGLHSWPNTYPTPGARDHINHQED